MRAQMAGTCPDQAPAAAAVTDARRNPAAVRLAPSGEIVLLPASSPPPHRMRQATRRSRLCEIVSWHRARCTHHRTARRRSARRGLLYVRSVRRRRVVPCVALARLCLYRGETYVCVKRCLSAQAAGSHEPPP